MFKALGNLLHRTPWWALLLIGVVTLIVMAMFAAPVRVMRLANSGDSPQMNRAIQREIDSAFGDSALGVAEGVVAAMRKGTNDPERRAELDRAQEEIARAREEILNAQQTVRDTAREVAHDATEAAIDAAKSAAESSLDVAVERREAIEEARADVERALKSVGAAGGDEALRTLDSQLQAAKAQEAKIRAAMEALNKPAKKVPAGKKPLGVQINGDGLSINLNSDKQPASPNPPAPPAPPGSNKINIEGSVGGKPVKGSVTVAENDFKLELDAPDAAPPPLPPLPPLAPELRRQIHERVATDVRRIGIGGALIVAFIPLFFMTLIAKYFIDRSRRAQAFAEAQQKVAETQSAGRQIMEARLQALQAQVEPHFLYNTLANVQALTEVDPPAANKMVGHLIDYLRAALPKMRETTSTVGQEVELARAYLNILKMRMGPRLDFNINVPPELSAVPFPPLMLPSLVENAIKHGLEPMREGGRVDVIAEMVGDRLRVSVTDTGRGLAADGNLNASMETGGGVGLANIRERLQALYGAAGKLTLESNTEARGVKASIEIPINAAASFSANGGMPLGVGGFAKQEIALPKTWWGRARRAASTTHGVWARAMSFTFIGIMILLAILFGLALAGMATGWLPVNFGGTEIKGMEGLAFGSVALLFVFGVLAIAAMLIVALIYGLGVLAAGLLIFIPLMIVISMFPALAPFALVGLFIYWIFFRRKNEEKKS